MPKKALSALATGCNAIQSASTLSPAADHGDMPSLAGIGRTDAQTTDLFAFTRCDSLILALCTDPGIPPAVSSYIYPSDLTLEISIDRHSKVRFDDAASMLKYGGTIVRPEAVVAACRFRLTFDDEGQCNLTTHGIVAEHVSSIQVFTGLRDDPFIRLPRTGRNVAAVVIELPLQAVAKKDQTLLIWATTAVPGIEGPVGDHAGRALRSMFIDPANVLSPQKQFLELGMTPDVVILDVSRPSGFPNGRLLTDDVVDLVVDMPLPGGTLPGEAPDFPTENDVPFLGNFPYLAPPH
jgi:hypothetical protein